VIAAARAEAVEVRHSHVVFLQIMPAGEVGLIEARRADMVRGQRVAEDPQDARTA